VIVSDTHTKEWNSDINNRNINIFLSYKENSNGKIQRSLWKMEIFFQKKTESEEDMDAKVSIFNFSYVYVYMMYHVS